MTTQLDRPTAKIYAFPTGGRAPPSRYRDRPRTGHAPVTRLPSQEHRLAIQDPSGWYHEEAVEQES